MFPQPMRAFSDISKSLRPYFSSLAIGTSGEKWNKTSCLAKRAGWRSRTSHKDYATPKSICFSNATSMSPCTGQRLQIQHSSGCLFPWLPVPRWCTARAADNPSQPPWHSHCTAGNGMDCWAWQEIHSACIWQAHTPKGVCSHADFYQAQVDSKSKPTADGWTSNTLEEDPPTAPGLDNPTPLAPDGHSTPLAQFLRESPAASQSWLHRELTRTAILCRGRRTKAGKRVGQAAHWQRSHWEGATGCWQHGCVPCPSVLLQLLRIPLPGCPAVLADRHPFPKRFGHGHSWPSKHLPLPWQRCTAREDSPAIAGSLLADDHQKPKKQAQNSFSQVKNNPQWGRESPV
ncbi:uncharacterized protein LOC127470311 [Manacus candei]|uniref:uncharacterized protein LOC127470311 n=1 Tax=Manacus candei TaxID=415023 RepID=UPI0022280269|nr:uncharacterized protein LOC127470311 [Manacus candei]